MLVVCMTLEKEHVGQFPQDGEKGQNVPFFWSSAATKRSDFLILPIK